MTEPKEYTTQLFTSGNDDTQSREKNRGGAAREKWTGKLDFILSCLGSVIGLGNIWRFSYLCFRSGGGAFLIPYTLMLFLLGIPMVLMEMAIGQYGAMAPLCLYKNMCPALRCVGIIQFIIVFTVSTYYFMIMAWAIFYQFASFTSDLPWQYCNHEYNSYRCFNDVAYRECKSNNNSIYNMGRCFTNQTEAAEYNITADISPELRRTASLEYLMRYVFDISSGVSELGEVKWDLVFCLLASWTVVFFCLLRGIRTSGKVVYFTATFPFVLLVVLVIRGTTLPGAYEGIKFYMVPHWNKLLEIEVWEKAAVQIFFSLTVSAGTMSNFASFNDFHTNIIRTTFIITIGNSLTSIFAGFAVFSILGFMAHELGVPVGEVATKGAGLAFVAYPDAVTRLPAAPLWAILFFFMLILLGIDSGFAIVENLSSSLRDEFPWLRPRMSYVTLGVCSLGFLLGIPYTTQAGNYLVTFMDQTVGSWPILLSGFLEIMAVAHAYGIDMFLLNLEDMTGFRPGVIFRRLLQILYKFVIPGIISVLILLTWVNYRPLRMGSYVYPFWSNVIAWILVSLIFSTGSAVFFYDFCWTTRNLPWRKRFSVLTTPTDAWWRNAIQYRLEDMRQQANSMEVFEGERDRLPNMRIPEILA